MLHLVVFCAASPILCLTSWADSGAMVGCKGHCECVLVILWVGRRAEFGDNLRWQSEAVFTFEEIQGDDEASVRKVLRPKHVAFFQRAPCCNLNAICHNFSRSAGVAERANDTPSTRSGSDPVAAFTADILGCNTKGRAVALIGSLFQTNAESKRFIRFQCRCVRARSSGHRIRGN